MSPHLVVSILRLGNQTLLDHGFGKPEIIGVSRYYMNPQTRSAEFAVIVRDAFQGAGLGQHLMERLIAVARERGVRELVGAVLRENGPMLSLARELGFREQDATDRDAVATILDRIDPAVELSEPFGRIRDAIAEARKMGVTSRAA